MLIQNSSILFDITNDNICLSSNSIKFSGSFNELILSDTTSDGIYFFDIRIKLSHKNYTIKSLYDETKSKTIHFWLQNGSRMLSGSRITYINDPDYLVIVGKFEQPSMEIKEFLTNPTGHFTLLIDKIKIGTITVAQLSIKNNAIIKATLYFGIIKPNDGKIIDLSVK
jgi:hypothetical protein